MNKIFANITKRSIAKAAAMMMLMLSAVQQGSANPDGKINLGTNNCSFNELRNNTNPVNPDTDLYGKYMKKSIEGRFGKPIQQWQPKEFGKDESKAVAPYYNFFSPDSGSQNGGDSYNIGGVCDVVNERALVPGSKTYGKSNIEDPTQPGHPLYEQYVRDHVLGGSQSSGTLNLDSGAHGGSTTSTKPAIDVKGSLSDAAFGQKAGNGGRLPTIRQSLNMNNNNGMCDYHSVSQSEVAPAASDRNVQPQHDTKLYDEYMKKSIEGKFRQTPQQWQPKEFGKDESKAVAPYYNFFSPDSGSQNGGDSYNIGGVCDVVNERALVPGSKTYGKSNIEDPTQPGHPLYEQYVRDHVLGGSQSSGTLNLDSGAQMDNPTSTSSTPGQLGGSSVSDKGMTDPGAGLYGKYEEKPVVFKRVKGPSKEVAQYLGGSYSNTGDASDVTEDIIDLDAVPEAGFKAPYDLTTGKSNLDGSKIDLRLNGTSMYDVPGYENLNTNSSYCPVSYNTTGGSITGPTANLMIGAAPAAAGVAGTVLSSIGNNLSSLYDLSGELVKGVYARNLQGQGLNGISNLVDKGVKWTPALLSMVSAHPLAAAGLVGAGALGLYGTYIATKTLWHIMGSLYGSVIGNGKLLKDQETQTEVRSEPPASDNVPVAASTYDGSRIEELHDDNESKGDIEEEIVGFEEDGVEDTTSNASPSPSENDVVVPIERNTGLPIAQNLSTEDQNLVSEAVSVLEKNITPCTLDNELCFHVEGEENVLSRQELAERYAKALNAIEARKNDNAPQYNDKYKFGGVTEAGEQILTQDEYNNSLFAAQKTFLEAHKDVVPVNRGPVVRFEKDGRVFTWSQIKKMG